MSCKINIKFGNRPSLYSNNGLYGTFDSIIQKLKESVGDSINPQSLLNEWFDTKLGQDSITNLIQYAPYIGNIEANDLKLLILDRFNTSQTDLKQSIFNQDTSLLDDISKIFRGSQILEVYRRRDFRRNVFRSMIIKDKKIGQYNKLYLNIIYDFIKSIDDSYSINFDDDQLIKQMINRCVYELNSNNPSNKKEVENAIALILMNSVSLVKDNESLNIAISRYKDRQYSIISRFIKSIDDSFNTKKSYLNEKGQVETDYIQDLFNRFENYINEFDNLDEFLNQVLYDKLNGSRYNLLLDAVYAYINIKHFNETLKEEFGDNILINSDMIDEPSLYTIDGNSIRINYFIGKDFSTAVKSWNVGEIRDAIKLTTKLEKILIGLLVLYDHTNPSSQIEDKIDITAISTAWGHLVLTISLFQTSTRQSERLKELILFAHDNISDNLLEALYILFNNVRSPLKGELLALSASGGTLTNPDLNILYSIYKLLYSNQSRDIISNNNLPTLTIVENNDIRSKNIGLGKYLLQDIILCNLDRSSPIVYSATKYERGVAVSSFISKSNTIDKLMFDYRDSRNIALRRSNIYTRKPLIDKYNLTRINAGEIEITFNKGENDERTYRIIAGQFNNSSIASSFINDKNISIIVRPKLTNEELEQLFSIAGDNKELIDIINSDPFDKTVNQLLLEAIQNSDFENKDHLINILKTDIQSQLSDNYGVNTLSGILNNEDLYKLKRNLLEFIDDFLKLNLLTKEGLLTVGYYRATSGRTLLPMFINAITIALEYTMLQDLENSGSTDFKLFMISQDQNLSKIWGNYTVIDSTLGINSFIAIRKNQEWINKWFEAQGVLTGLASAATTKDSKGNSRPNYRPSSLGSLPQTKYVLEKAKRDTNNVTNKTLFVQDSSLIKDVVSDSEMSSWDSTKKVVSEGNTGELIYHSILHNFWNRMLSNNTIQVIPTVYSDKTTFVSYIIDMAKLINGKHLIRMSADEYEDLYFNSLKDYFVRSYQNILHDWSILLNIPENIEAVLFALKKLNEEQLLELIYNYNKNHEEKINIALDVHYRVDKATGKLEFNELVYHYAEELYKDKENLHNRFEKEKINFVKALINNNVNFYSQSVLTEDTIINQIISGNLLFNSENESQEREQFKQKWIKNGHLVLAYDKNGNEIKYESLLTNIDKLSLNPILEKYFYINNIVSANIKYAIVGSEVADPNKAAKLNFKKDFDILSVNSDGTNKSEVDKLILSKLSPNLIRELQKTDLVSLRLLINESRRNNIKDSNGITNNLYNQSDELDRSEELENALQLEGDEFKRYVDFEFHEFDDEYDPNTYNEEEERKLIRLQIEFYNNEALKYENLGDETILKWLEDKYNSLIYRVIATSEGSLYKRNVIIPTTRTDVQMNSITGTGTTTKVAIFKDIKAPVHTINGDNDTEDADDGSASITPFQAILENNSLGVNEVGYNNKKPIWYYFDPTTGTSGLLKFATFTLTNGLMRMSISSEASHYKLFKKMTNMLWKEDIDLLNSCQYRDDLKLDFYTDILSLCKDGKLFYQYNGETKEIHNMINHDGIYYTEEQYLSIGANRHLVAQLFDDNSNEIKIEQKDGETNQQFFSRINTFIQQLRSLGKNLHTINSLFELHTSLGGINSQELSDRGFVWSENSNYAVVGFMNSVALHNEGMPYSLNQNNYTQPLKKYLIGYAANVSANKRVLFNVQSSDNYFNDHELLYTELSNFGLGVQMNGDHEADQAELSEPTQVIASLDAGGYTHDIAKLAFLDLGKVAAEGLKVQVQLLTDLIASQGTTDIDKDQLSSEIYDVFGRTFLRTYIARNITDLSVSIINALKDNFIKSETHILDDFKIPVSDPNIFNEIISNFTSTLSKKSLKRKYAGLGTIMVPGYKKAQIYHIGNDDFMFDDILLMANENNAILTILDNAKRSADGIASSGYIKSWRNRQGKNNAWYFRINLDPRWSFDDSKEGQERYGMTEVGFELVLNNEDPNMYDIHFKNPFGIDNYRLTNLEKARLYIAIRRFLPVGATIKTTDEISRGAVSGFKNLEKFGFIPTNDIILYKLNKDSNPFGINEKYGYDVSTDGNNTYVSIPVYTTSVLSLIDENKLLVEAFLLDKQEFEPTKLITEFLPTDIATIKGHTNLIFDLENINDYYKFIDRDWWYFIAKNRSDKSIPEDRYISLAKLQLIQAVDTYLILNNIEINQDNRANVLSTVLLDLNILKQFNNKYIRLLGGNLEFQECVTRPKSLRPQRGIFTINGKLNNIYNLNSVRKSLLSGKRDPKGVQQEMLKLTDEGIATLYNSSNPDLPIEVKIDEDSLKIQEAELMMSNIYKSIFDQGNRSLALIMENFNPKLVKRTKIQDASLIIVGKNLTGVVFGKPSIYDKYARMDTKIVKDGDEYKIMALSKDKSVQEPYFLVGVQRESNKYYYTKLGDNFVFTYAENGLVVDTIQRNNRYIDKQTGIELIERNGKVYENTYFVRKIYKNLSVAGKEIKQYYYYIDNDLISNYTNGEDDFFINDLLYKITKYEDGLHLLLNGNQEFKNKVLLSRILSKRTDSDKTFDEANEISLKFINNMNDDIDLYKRIPSNNRLMLRNYFSVDINGEQLTYNEAIQRLYKKIAEEVKKSYKLSRYFVAARIPAQSLQSYMKMKLVGYIPIGENECMVSHILTFLQGSDYDIDKAYIMGLEFDKNGRFKDWSPLFDYSTDETLQASLYLPTPEGLKIEDSIDIDNAIDINDDLNEIFQNENNKAKSLLLKGKLISKLLSLKKSSNSNIITIKTVRPELKYILNEILNHEDYANKMNPDDREDIFKNAVSARIQLISANPKNMSLAYSPINMDDLKRAADRSKKGGLIYGLTGMNPATQCIMQKQNMDGKAVIGISAVGEKIFMYLSYYFNEGIRSNDVNYARHMKFLNTTTRIQNRSNGNPIEVTKGTIADTNWYGILNADELQQRMIDIDRIQQSIIKNNPDITQTQLQEETKNRILNFTQADLMISLLLSAATDNAKELILSKINAGKDLARVYLHLLILGYNLNDIVSFMTSPAVELVSKILNTNMFQEGENNINVETAIKKALGDFSPLRYFKNPSFVYRNFNNIVLDDLYNNNSQEWKILLNIFKEENINTDREKFLFLLNRYPHYINSYRSIFSTSPEILTEWNIFINEYEKTKSYINEAAIEDPNYILDLNEFYKIYKESQETTNLGTLLGWNREIPTKYADLLNKIHQFENMMIRQARSYIQYTEDKNTKEKILNIQDTIDVIVSDKPYLTRDYVSYILKQATNNHIHDQFDFNKFMTDNDYLKLSIDFYDLIKSNYNIYDVMVKSPNHMQAMIAHHVASLIIKINSMKATIVDQMRVALKNEGEFLNDEKISKLINYADELLIYKFISNRDIKFPINYDLVYYDQNFDEHVNTSPRMQPLKTYDDIANFKKWFESYLLPLIQSGRVIIGDDIIPIDPSNELVEYITDGSENNKPIKKLSLVMSNIERDTRTALLFQKALNGLNNIDKYNRSQYKISDYFMLYGLLVYRNRPGNDRITLLFTLSVMKGSNLISDYLKFVGNEDYKIKDLQEEKAKQSYLLSLGYSNQDALFKIAPIYTRYTKYLARERFIIVREGTELHYEVRTNPYLPAGQGYEVYKGFEFFNDRSTQLRKLRFYNFMQDSLIFIPNIGKNLQILLMLNSSDESLIQTALLSLMKDRILKINIIC